MNIAFRVDASTEIGTGHFMRCLALANELHFRGATICFICRKLPELLRKKLLQAGHQLVMLTGIDHQVIHSKLFHAYWLGVNVLFDAEEVRTVLAGVGWDWVVVDHYGIDQSWEALVANSGCRVMAIDDLADRKHDCHVLLDQTMGREKYDYQSLVPNDCTLFLGANYALLRPEFRQWRVRSLQRRKRFVLENVLITLGGFVKPDDMLAVFSALEASSLPTRCYITVITGVGGEAKKIINNYAKSSSYQIIIKENVDNMAQLMAESDLLIGAAGSTLWERCCLGLPAIILILAKNQMYAASNMAANNVAWVAETPCQISHLIRAYQESMQEVTRYQQLITNISHVTAGLGCQLLADYLMEE